MGYNTPCILYNCRLWNEKHGNHIILGDLALENVEALAQGEGGGESGTSVGYCYLQGYGGTTSGYKVYCDRQTSNGKIYPCPSESMGSYSESARDRCTK